jgi:hypothetical protein
LTTRNAKGRRQKASPAQIEWLPLAEVKPYPNNPRRNADAVGAVARSIQEFGFQQPIVVDAEGIIIVGHTRYEAAQSLGLERVPVMRADLSPERARAYRIVDNRTAEYADWDQSLLLEEVDALGDEMQRLLKDLDLEVLEGPDKEAQPFEFGETEDVSVVQIRCPLPLQAEIRERLKGLEGIEIAISNIPAP